MAVMLKLWPMGHFWLARDNFIFKNCENKYISILKMHSKLQKKLKLYFSHAQTMAHRPFLTRVRQFYCLKIVKINVYIFFKKN